MFSKKNIRYLENDESKRYNYGIGRYLGLGLGAFFGVMIVTAFLSVILYIIFNGTDKFLELAKNLQKITEDKNFLYLSMIAQVMVETLAVVLIVILIRKDLASDAKDTKNKLWAKIGFILGGAVLMPVLLLLVDVIYKKLGISTSSENQDILEALIKGDQKIVMFFSVAILAPIYEELVYRKLIAGFLAKTRSLKILNFVIVSLVFAFIHVQSEIFELKFAPLLPYLLISMVVTGVYYLTNENIYASMIAHFLNNLLAFVALVS